MPKLSDYCELTYPVSAILWPEKFQETSFSYSQQQLVEICLGEVNLGGSGEGGGSLNHLRVVRSSQHEGVVSSGAGLGTVAGSGRVQIHCTLLYTIQREFVFPPSTFCIAECTVHLQFKDIILYNLLFCFYGPLPLLSVCELHMI